MLIATQQSNEDVTIIFAGISLFSVHSNIIEPLIVHANAFLCVTEEVTV